MSKIILASNRLAVSVSSSADGFSFTPSVGGLATGLSSFLQRSDSLWVGWSGIADDTVSSQEREYIRRTLRDEYQSVTIPMDQQDLQSFYYGFCNNVIWPLFHYFPTYVQYDPVTWESYYEINHRFFQAIRDVAEPDDHIWIHDYQLMLLPAMVREELPDARIGFFLHIPFPSYELFRLLPWRQELLRGMLGADLVGFHTYDYARHFLSSIRRLLGLDNNLGVVRDRNRMSKVDVFPMGIDYEKYSTAHESDAVQQEIETVRSSVSNRQVILSVDRLDYSKGIPNRLQAYAAFLEQFPEYHEHVELVMIVAPSRTEVPRYQRLKRELDQLVSTINGQYGTIEWVPIKYFFRAFPFERLCALYSCADVLLVTPIRDGMNLIAKEYVAARSDLKGTVVLSETAGAAREMSESMVVNPSDINTIANRIRDALERDPQDEAQGNRRIHDRLRRYDIHFWARDFMDKLDGIVESRENLRNRRLRGQDRGGVLEAFAQAEKRLIFLNYDGTLVEFGDGSAESRPNERLLDNIARLAADERNEVVIVSSRPREDLERWFYDTHVGLVAEYGVWIRPYGEEWNLIEQLDNDWKDMIRPVLERHSVRTPGSRVEESEFSLGWSYGHAEPELASVRKSELRDTLLSLTGNLNLSILEGQKTLEIKSSEISKGRAALRWLNAQEWEFIFAVGDDWSDEELFSVLPEHAYSIKVGVDISHARFFLENEAEVRDVIREMTERTER
ncbi:MAG: bifunctional alpha,alpha-trehalose-phosphate synthase (UDP-forming)/trehalose-phosphatase [Spirochaetota bacterium]